MKEMTEKQKRLDNHWLSFISQAKEYGFLLNEEKGVALISTHEIQYASRTFKEYIRCQLKNGNTPEKLGLSSDSLKEKIMRES